MVCGGDRLGTESCLTAPDGGDTFLSAKTARWSQGNAQPDLARLPALVLKVKGRVFDECQAPSCGCLQAFVAGQGCTGVCRAICAGGVMLMRLPTLCARSRRRAAAGFRGRAVPVPAASVPQSHVPCAIRAGGA